MDFVSWGLPVVLAMFPESTTQKNATKYYPLIESALNDEGLVDVKMKLVAYATIRAETAGFRPIEESESRYNTLRSVDTSNLSDRNMKMIADLNARIVQKYELSNKFSLYDYRKDLGHNGRGEGERYKGRGFIQLTGKENYVTFSKILALPDLVTDPDIALKPEVAARVLAAFIKRASGRIREALQSGNLSDARKAVNGGTHGLDRFLEAYDRGAKLALARDRPVVA